MYIVHGIPISIVTNIENSILFSTMYFCFFAIAEDIAGTKAVANAILKENGNATSTSTFPLNIPY